MADSKESIPASCGEVCQKLAEQEKEWLDNFYRQTIGGIKEKETVELVQHAIGLPLQAQERVQELFAKLGVAYVNTAWRELSAQLPKLNYEYIDWSLPPTDRMNGGVRDGYEKETTTLKKRDAEKSISKVTKKFKKSDPDVKNGKKRQTENNTKQIIEELRWRIREVKRSNMDRVDHWCAELKEQMVSVLEKHLPLK